MITPSFSLTSTERVLPRLALDFTTASLDPRVTVTRADATASRVNSSGYVETVAADTPRFDFDPVTLFCKGLLIEEARTNIYVQSITPDGNQWTRQNCSIGSASTTAPDGSSSAPKLIMGNGIPPDGATADGLYQVKTNPGTGDFAWTLYAKADEHTGLRVRENIFSGAFMTVNLLTGAISFTSGGGAFFRNAKSTNVGNGWWSITWDYTGWSTTSARYSVRSATTGDGTSGFFVWHQQMEAGLFPTSPIITPSNAPVTRNADVVNMTGTNFSDWYNATEGAAAIWFNGFESGNGNLLTFSDGTNQNFISNFVQAATTYGLYTISSGALQAAINFGTPATLNTQNKIVMGYKAASNSASFNGAAVVTSNSGTIPTVNRLNIGSDPVLTAGNFFNGTVQKIAYWPYKLTDAQIRAFAK